MFGCFLGIDGAIGGFSSSTPTFTVSITGLTANPTFGQTAEIGTTITAVAQGFSGNEPATIAYQWQKDGADIAGATSDTYSPSAPDDLVALTCRVSPDGYAPRTSSAYTVRYAPPVITTQPAVTPSSGAVGTVFTLTEPIALNSVITLTNFTLSGVDKTSELVGLTWGSSGENAGDIAAAFTVENSGGLIVAQADATLTGAASNSLNIIASRTSVLGEQAINFEPDLASLGSLVGADPRKDILWNWDFGEVGASYLYHDPSMPWANNPNHKQGPRVAHSFTTYGSGVTQFTVTLTGRDAAGNVETGQILIDVENPDDHVYSKVYAVSFASNFTGAPAGATQLTNEADFRSAIFAEDGNSDVRFIFRSGETYTFTVAQSRRIGFSGCFGGVYGGTAPAILTTNMGNPGSGAWTRNDLFLIGGNAGDLLIKDLDFQGAYDPLTGTCSDALIQMFSCYNNITEITFHRIKAVGVHMLCVWNTDSGRVSFSDTYCSDFYDYAVFFNQPNSTNGVLNMYGGYWSQDPAVGPIFTGDGTNKFTNPDFPNQGPLRRGNGKTLCVNDMWFGSDLPPETSLVLM